MPVMNLESDVVHVWIAEFDELTRDLPMLETMLSPDEMARAGRYHSKCDREHYVAARGTLRVILARYSDGRPKWLRFSYGPHGKPMLASEGSIRFNLSHSDGLVIYAVTLGREVGVDIERIGGAEDLDVLAEHFFSIRENAAYRSLPAAQRRDAFFACWTRKEAFLKARGEGLSLPLSDFDVEFAPDKPPALLSVNQRRATGSSEWTMHDVASPEGYKAAVVVEGPGCRVVPMRFTVGGDYYLPHT